MASINLVIDSYNGKSNSHRLLARKSSVTLVPIPYPMNDHSPLVDACTAVIPQEWSDAIEALTLQERAIIKQRSTLMEQYRKEFILLVQPIVEQFPQTHPEYFI